MVAPATASACSCAPEHAATKIAQAQHAVVGVVESESGGEHVVRVTRTIKGVAAERVTLHSRTNSSCQARFPVGQWIGVVYNDGGEIFTCSYVDPGQLVAASKLPAPSGTPRLSVAIDGVPGTDTVLLGARGQVAAYGWPQGQVLAQASCGSAVVGADGKIRLARTEVPLSTVMAVGCSESGRRVWAIGNDRGQVRLLSVRAGQVRLGLRRAADAVAIAGRRAYFVHGGNLVRIVPLGSGRLRSARIDGEFVTISGHGDRVAGLLSDGRSAVLNVRTGKLIARRADGGRLTWLSGNRLLGVDGVYDSQLRRLRAVTTRGSLIGVVDGAAFFAYGNALYRLAPGGRRAVRFARLPGPPAAIMAAPTSRAAKASWHSCEPSANSPLTT